MHQLPVLLERKRRSKHAWEGLAVAHDTVEVRCAVKTSFGRDFESASAMFLAVGMYSDATILRSTSSRMKRSRLS
eukprot:6899857-Prymnesium_polylepis.1